MRYVSIVVTNWNGRSLLERCIPSVLEAMAADLATVTCELIVVDDHSSDDSLSYLAEFGDKLQVVIPSRNLGFQGASNFGVAYAKYDILIMLNNDIMLPPGCIGQIAAHFDDQTVFAVSTRVLLWDKETYLAGKRVGIFERGHFRLEDEDYQGGVTNTLFATGGAAGFCRRKYQQLAGFDRIFHPLYWEDVDLCYRAHKRGYKVLYDPQITMYHKHQASIGKMFDRTNIRYITARNSYLFLWKNVSDAKMWLEMLLWTPIFLVRDLFKLRYRFLVSFFMALLRLPMAIARNYREKKYETRTDRQILHSLIS